MSLMLEVKNKMSTLSRNLDDRISELRSAHVFDRLRNKTRKVSLATLIFLALGSSSLLGSCANNRHDKTKNYESGQTKIAFVSERDGNKEIYVMNPDGSEQKNLTNNPAFDGSPSWSPDGKRIAFHSYRDGNREIYVMNPDGTDQKRLTNNPAGDKYPSWSPDGKKIAFSSWNGKGEIYVINSDGSNQTRLTYNPSKLAHNWLPSWSPVME